MARDRDSGSAAVAPRRRRLAGVRFALPASVALHAVVLYAAARFHWSAPPLVHSVVAPSVVWLEIRPPEPAPEERLPPPEVEPPQEPAQLPEQPTEPPPEPPDPEPPHPEPAEEPPRSAEESAPQPEPEAAPEPAPRPPIDWDAERRRAVVRMSQEQESSHRTFSLDDLPERPEPEVTPPTPIAEVMEDGCLIAKNRFQRMAMMMLGRCVRTARDDLFADVMPSYLEKVPVCVDTREAGVPAVESASGREYPTVKCRLVDPEQP